MNCPSFLTAIVGISDFNDLFLKPLLTKLILLFFDLVDFCDFVVNEFASEGEVHVNENMALKNIS